MNGMVTIFMKISKTYNNIVNNSKLSGGTTSLHVWHTAALLEWQTADLHR